MRQVPNIAVVAGATVYLKPGGYHIMLLGLRSPLSAGQVVPITFVFESATKQRSSMVVDAIVRLLASPGVPSNHHETNKKERRMSLTHSEFPARAVHAAIDHAFSVAAICALGVLHVYLFRVEHAAPAILKLKLARASTCLQCTRALAPDSNTHPKN